MISETGMPQCHHYQTFICFQKIHGEFQVAYLLMMTASAALNLALAGAYRCAVKHLTNGL